MTSPGHRSPGHGEPPAAPRNWWHLGPCDGGTAPRGYRGTLILPRGPGLWPTPPAGTATAAPTSALTADRAPWDIMANALNPHFRGRRKKLPSRTRDTSTATRAHGRQRFRSATAVPVVPALSVTRCNDNEEDRRLLDLRPHLLGVAAQGAQLLLRQVPRAASPLGPTGSPRSLNIRADHSPWQTGRLQSNVAYRFLLILSLSKDAHTSHRWFDRFTMSG